MSTEWYAADPAGIVVTRVTPVGEDNHWRDREYPGGIDSGN